MGKVSKKNDHYTLTVPTPFDFEEREKQLKMTIY